MALIIKYIHDHPKARDEYIRWMEAALLPQHRHAANLIESKAHLFESEKMSSYMLDYVSMVRSYDVIQTKWAIGDYTTLFSPLRYPAGLMGHVEESFLTLRCRQLDLLEQPVDPLHSIVHSWLATKREINHILPQASTRLRRRRDQSSSSNWRLLGSVARILFRPPPPVSDVVDDVNDTTTRPTPAASSSSSKDHGLAFVKKKKSSDTNVTKVASVLVQEASEDD